MTDETLRFLYRYDTSSSDPRDAYPYCHAYQVRRATARGLVIDVWGVEKFVLAGSDGKRFAYTTKEAALRSFVKRKERRLKLLSAAMARETAALAVARGMVDRGETEAPAEKAAFWPELF